MSINVKMLKLFEEIELKFSNIEAKIEKRTTETKSLCNQQSELLNLNYDLARLEQKYVNELNKQRDELLNQIPSKMRLELDVVNEKVGLNDANRVETLLGALNKPRKLKLKLNRIDRIKIWMQKVMNKEFEFARMFSASNLVKYKNILSNEHYLAFGYLSFDIKKNHK